MSAIESLLRFTSSSAINAEDLLAVVSDRDSETTVKNLIVDQSIASACVQRGTIDDAIQLLKTLDRSPRQLIVDVSGSAMPISDLARLSDVCDPSVAVVVVGERNDVDLYRSLLGAGVQDYLFKPLSVGLLQRALTARDPAATLRTGNAVCFAGARGGVGTTTIAVSLARFLADVTHRRIAYVDLNFHGGAVNSMLRLTTNNGLTELLQNPQRIDTPLINRMLVPKSNHLLVLSSELQYGNDFVCRPGAISELINALKRHFHYVMLDLSGVAGSIAEEAFDASAFVYITSDRSVHAARETARLLRFTEDRDSDPTITLLLNNQHEPVAGRVDAADFQRALGRASMVELPYEPKTLAAAENLGEPIAAGKPTPFTSAVVELANMLTGRTEAAPPKPWYARLAGNRGRR
ncbi:AAA family ATPase [Paraburkholderia sp. BL10I2N1]|uniref:AAA family ATPase n=1 Tax=Paraburkholderia sp. BL10I2N1 TaxID=1938796 RepID=UPI0010E6F435|nr:AAA family ATPase [Paraburkholderia sp. BL10I2N1]TDN67274.1 pilus assembly protein CpaE [Paraburkholderia sp. BL10I2N1]